MNLYPAIDLYDGRCVRLVHGERSKMTVYNENPFEAAEIFHRQGARWLHVVDLNAAFGDGSNRKLIGEIAAAFPELRIQTGGGLRTLDDLQEAFSFGISRAVVASMAVKRPQILQQALSRFGPQKLAVALDSRNGRIAIEGWEKESSVSLIGFSQQLAEMGVETGIYTDISRDGTLSGPDLQGLRSLLDATSLRLIASGGVHHLDDLQAIADMQHPRLEGVIIGKALYEQKIDLRTAVAKFQE